MEMRIVVSEAGSASALVQKLSALLGADRVALWGERNEVGVRIEGKYRARDLACSRRGRRLARPSRRQIGTAAAWTALVHDGAMTSTAIDLRGSAIAPGGIQRLGGALERLCRSRKGRRVLTVGSGVFAIGTLFLAGRHFAETSWPFSQANPGLLVAAGVLTLFAYGFKARGWQRLFAPAERPHSLALAAANGGASVGGVALPGRFDDAIRIAIVRRSPGCPAGIRSLCLSLVMLGLIDSAALAPLAFAGAVLPGASMILRAGLAVVAVAGLAAALVILALPRLAVSSHVVRFRLARWLSPRTTSLSDAARSWGLVSVCWLVRAVALFLLLGALGVGFSFPLALLVLCAGAAAAALPVGPAGAATQAGAGTAVLIASGIGPSQALGVAVSIQAMGVLMGGLILLFAALCRVHLRLSPSRR